jgi:nitrate/TMAO reductase-like tetraheme cytochrome c subunit
MLRPTTFLMGFLLLAGSAFAQTTAANVDDYVWAGACKQCHSAQYTAWETTKHARTIGRLSATERESTCAGCHTTAGPALLDKDLNANVQCEQCHGAGRAHVQAAAAGPKPGAIVRAPAERVCVGCHSEKSPHFKFFSYAALSRLVHQTPK